MRTHLHYSQQIKYDSGNFRAIFHQADADKICQADSDEPRKHYAP